MAAVMGGESAMNSIATLGPTVAYAVKRNISETTKPTIPESDKKIKARTGASTGMGIPRIRPAVTVNKTDAKTTLKKFTEITPMRFTPCSKKTAPIDQQTAVPKAKSSPILSMIYLTKYHKDGIISITPGLPGFYAAFAPL